MSDPSHLHINRRRIIQGAALGASAAALSLKPFNIVRAAEIGKIKIVSPIPLTGPLASDGLEMQRGLQMAVDEAKAAGTAGGDIDLVFIDTEDMTQDKVSNAFSRAIDEENADAIIIGYATGTTPEYDLLAEADNPPPYIHFNTFEATAQIVRKDPRKYYMVFEGDPTEIWYGQGILTLMENLQSGAVWTPSSQKAAVVTSDNLYSQSIANAFKDGAQKLGWQIVVDEKVATPVANWDSVIGKIRDTQPAMIVNTDFNPADLAAFTKDVVADPPPALLYEQYGPSIPEFLNLAGDAANGVVWSTVIGVLPDKLGEDWKARYTAKFGEAPGLSNSGSCFDAVNLYLTAVTQVGSKDRKAVCDAIRGITYRGVCGAYRFDPADQTAIPYPDVEKDPEKGMPHLFFQIQAGKQVLTSPDPFTTGTFQLPPWLAK